MPQHICACIQNGKYVERNPILSLAKFQSLNDHFHLYTEINKNHFLQEE